MGGGLAFVPGRPFFGRDWFPFLGTCRVGRGRFASGMVGRARLGLLGLLFEQPAVWAEVVPVFGPPPGQGKCCLSKVAAYAQGVPAAFRGCATGKT